MNGKVTGGMSTLGPVPELVTLDAEPEPLKIDLPLPLSLVVATLWSAWESVRVICIVASNVTKHDHRLAS